MDVITLVIPHARANENHDVRLIKQTRKIPIPKLREKIVPNTWYDDVCMSIDARRVFDEQL